MQYVCKRKCFVNNRQYNVGDTETFEEGKASPHFQPVKASSKKEESSEPRTFHGINRRDGANAAQEDDEESRKVIESLGHKVNKPMARSNIDPFSEEDSGLSILD